jgi:hypothetical protein
MNQFDTARRQQQRETTARHDGYVRGRLDGLDAGRTEAFNDICDAIDHSTARTRLSKDKLKAHIMRQR